MVYLSCLSVGRFDTTARWCFPHPIEQENERPKGQSQCIPPRKSNPIVSHDGEQTIIYNGRALRAIKQYINKFKAHIQSKMDRCIKRSNRWYHLKRIKTKILAKLNAQLKDAEHKITSRFISDCIRAMASPIGVRFHQHLCKSG